MDYVPMIAQLTKYGDVIVAFCVVQSLAFAYKLSQTNDPARKAIITGGTVLVWLILVSGVFYASLTFLCGCAELYLRKAAMQPIQALHIARAIAWSRVAVVVFATIMVVVGLVLNLPKYSRSDRVADPQ